MVMGKAKRKYVFAAVSQPEANDIKVIKFLLKWKNEKIENAFGFLLCNWEIETCIYSFNIFNMEF